MPPTTVDEFLDAQPADRREALQAVRSVILANLSPGYEETIQYGAIGYVVPHSRYPHGYHCDPRQPLPFLGLAAPKSHLALHLFCLYVDEETNAWFESAYQATGKKLDKGKSCVRFKRIEDLPLELVAELVRKISVEEFIAHYEASLPDKERKKRGLPPRAV